MQDVPMESPAPVNHENMKEQKIQNKMKTVTLVSDKKTIKIDFKNEIEFLSIIAINQDGLFPFQYTGKFSLKDIQKVGLFKDYKSIDECLLEIFEGLDSEPTVTEKDNTDLIIRVPLHTRRFPEIFFPLKKIDKSESQKYKEMIDVLYNMKIEKEKKDKEISELKAKVSKLERVLQIKKEINTESSETYEGTKIELFTIGREQYSEFFPDKSIFEEDICGIGGTIILECNEKRAKEVIDKFNKYKSDIKEKLHLREFIDLNIRGNKDKIFIDIITFNSIVDEKKRNQNFDYLFNEVIKDHDPLLYIPFLTTGLKAILKTKVTLKDIFETNDEENLNKMIYDTTLSLKGDLMKLQVLMSFLILVCNNNKRYDSKEIYSLVNDIFLSVINEDCCYKIKNQDMFYNYKEDIEKLFHEIKHIFFECISIFKDKKFRVFQEVNFNKIKVGILGSPKFKVGFIGVNFSSFNVNEFIDKVLKGNIQIVDGKFEIDLDEKDNSRE